MSVSYQRVSDEFQQLEATAALRVLIVEGTIGGSYALDVSKQGAAFVDTSGGSVTEIENASGSGTGAFKVQLGQYDTDTLGDLAVELFDGTNYIYALGAKVREHNPSSDLYDLWCRFCGDLDADTSDDTVDAKDRDGAVRLTFTKSTSGTVTSWTVTRP